jgi:hypothetical protein
MVDISKCGGNDCPVKLECWRYTAPSGHWQAWGDFDKAPLALPCPRQIPIDASD